MATRRLTAKHPTPHDDGTEPWSFPGDDGEPEEPRRRTAADIADGADVIVDRAERVSFVMHLLETGEWDESLFAPLAEAWRVGKPAVREYLSEAGRAMVLDGAADAVRASVVARLRFASRLAERDPSPARAAQAVVGAASAEAKLLGLDRLAVAAARGKDEAERQPEADPGAVTVELVRCPTCGDDQLPGKRYCGGCGQPMAGT